MGCLKCGAKMEKGRKLCKKCEPKGGVKIFLDHKIKYVKCMDELKKKLMKKKS